MNLCKCGCGEETGTRLWNPVHLKRFVVKNWKRKNRSKVKEQERRRLRKRALKDKLQVEQLTQDLCSYLSRSWLIKSGIRYRLLSEAWFNITNWADLILPMPTRIQAIKFRSFWFWLRKSWSNITAWTECLNWTVTYTPDPEITGKWLVYGLVDPRTLEIRYVGKSQSGLHRPKQHRNKAGGYSGYKAGWLKELRKCGLTYNITILELTIEDVDTLNTAEQWWIAYGKLSNWRLTNLTDGGDGGSGRVLSAETKAKISLARKLGRPVNPRPTHPRLSNTHCINGHEYTEITISKGAAARGRVCLVCCRIRNQNRRNQKRYQKINKFK